MGLTKPPALEWRRLPVLGLSVVALLAGLTGALVLLGVPMPAGTLPLAATHGVLMTLGFLGTLAAAGTRLHKGASRRGPAGHARRSSPASPAGIVATTSSQPRRASGVSTWRRRSESTRPPRMRTQVAR